MEWLKQLNTAVNYIEEHLTDTIDMEKMAQIAHCSVFHFQRMFSYLAEVPLSEYIRRRKMTRAAFDLQNGNEKVIDIALKYGYESPTAFNRAFQSVHGIAPSIAKQSGIILKAFPPICFQ
ncbi:AraC-like DNA-binding protein [Mobilisporobacter senegalensis]|uniref:AraC-like DNA-binding protein n=1 Tax=Mobilisporobacter senegalensis TaxID=1329262 RepID=A0A3N1XPI1_9FIRM|nr:AraC-like DNA-binding protein [Mobilisporobacter senegalensis]